MTRRSQEHDWLLKHVTDNDYCHIDDARGRPKTAPLAQCAAQTLAADHAVVLAKEHCRPNSPADLSPLSSFTCFHFLAQRGPAMRPTTFLRKTVSAPLRRNSQIPPILRS